MEYTTENKQPRTISVYIRNDERYKEINFPTSSHSSCCTLRTSDSELQFTGGKME
jgi:K+/H+ antiporter YhaU regulatory subunit KhtT